ncbi:lysophospholipid transporter LplT [Acetonema longum]|uniref:Lysophospholipid transporter LplT n=1 Tax=Acetonema longum DSM 6540 TaxID=1009370 RepID=F7NHA2_9FIRM|nr:lysophospholipid transporter LplT [Acetonema longum]EGO64585.1 lysophospholipid transporter LplT [Acetonema longum DSM 6540]
MSLTGILPPLRAVLVLQFLSALADNMLLFIVQAVLVRDQYPAYYLSLVQSMYLLSYIVASPWVGLLADSIPKKRVLLLGNCIKTVTLLFLLLKINPAASYLFFGLGSVIFSPGKYGILPFLTTDDQELVRANSWLEGTTMIAILLGSLLGGWLSDHSILLSVGLASALYGLAVLISLLVPSNASVQQVPMKKAVQNFIGDVRFFLRHPTGRFSVLGSAYFWVAISILRLAIFIWAPLALGLTGNTPVSLLIGLIGIGMGIGAFAAPYVISIKTYRRAVYFGLVMAVASLILPLLQNLAVTLIILFLCGILGGMYIVPVNSLNESIGDATIGAGRGIAVQNFAENSLMLAGTSLYTFSTRSGVSVETNILATGAVFLLLMLHLMYLSRPQAAKEPQE